MPLIDRAGPFGRRPAHLIPRSWDSGQATRPNQYRVPSVLESGRIFLNQLHTRSPVLVVFTRPLRPTGGRRQRRRNKYHLMLVLVRIATNMTANESHIESWRTIHEQEREGVKVLHHHWRATACNNRPLESTPCFGTLPLSFSSSRLASLLALAPLSRGQRSRPGHRPIRDTGDRAGPIVVKTNSTRAHMSSSACDF